MKKLDLDKNNENKDRKTQFLVEIFAGLQDDRRTLRYNTKDELWLDTYKIFKSNLVYSCNIKETAKLKKCVNGMTALNRLPDFFSFEVLELFRHA